MAGYQLPDHEGLQHYRPSADLEVLYQPQPPVSAEWQPTEIDHQTESTPDKSPQNKRIAGVQKSTFWLALALGSSNHHRRRWQWSRRQPCRKKRLAVCHTSTNKTRRDIPTTTSYSQLPDRTNKVLRHPH